jgi:4-hydroxy-L-threonine phosphate dehydrogenase PdxA
MMDKPIIAVTMSEAAGIGPEILLKAIEEGSILEHCRPLAIGDWQVLEQVKEKLGLKVTLTPVQSFEEARWENGSIPLIDLADIPLDQLVPGRPNAVTGRSMLEQTKLAVQLFLDGKVQGSVGGPHSKKAAEEAGVHFD